MANSPSLGQVAECATLMPVVRRLERSTPPLRLPSRFADLMLQAAGQEEGKTLDPNQVRKAINLAFAFGIQYDADA